MGVLIRVKEDWGLSVCKSLATAGIFQQQLVGVQNCIRGDYFDPDGVLAPHRGLVVEEGTVKYNVGYVSHCLV